MRPSPLPPSPRSRGARGGGSPPAMITALAIVIVLEKGLVGLASFAWRQRCWGVRETGMLIQETGSRETGQESGNKSQPESGEVVLGMVVMLVSIVI